MAYAIYLRKSRADIEAESCGEGETLARHEKTLLSLGKKMGLQIGQIYKEIVSGETISARPVMQQLLCAVEQGVWEGVLVMEVERLARGDTIDQGIIAQAFKYSDTKIITPMKVYDPQNEFDEEYFEFGLFMSRREYKTINRRLQRGRSASAKEGKYIGNKPPYGYKRVKLQKEKGWSLEPIPDQAEIVRKIFDWFTDTAHPAGAATIVRRLNDRNIPTINGGDWVNTTVLGILSNPIYAGWIRWGYRPQVKSVSDGQVVKSRPRTPRESVMLTKGLHEPIISQEIFDLAAKRIGTFREQVGPKVDGGIKNPLSGLVVCERCGRVMVRRPYKGERQEYLICPYTSCPTVSSRLETVENHILFSLKDWLKGYEIENAGNIEIDSYTEDIEMESLSERISSLKQDVSALNSQALKAYDLVEQGIYTPEVFIERTRIISEKKETAESSLHLAEKELERLRKLKDSRETIAPAIRHVLDIYPTAKSPTEKNELLKSVLDKVVYRKTKRASKNGSGGDMQLTVFPKLPSL